VPVGPKNALRPLAEPSSDAVAADNRTMNSNTFAIDLPPARHGDGKEGYAFVIQVRVSNMYK